MTKQLPDFEPGKQDRCECSEITFVGKQGLLHLLACLESFDEALVRELDEMSTFAPLADIRAMQHASLSACLFAS